uniref:Putative secreted protein n=1 Tax=Anopheles marajoara TaxID=58244 RepID=A0A2M4C8E5_9DIPT
MADALSCQLVIASVTPCCCCWCCCCSTHGYDDDKLFPSWQRFIEKKAAPRRRYCLPHRRKKRAKVVGPQQSPSMGVMWRLHRQPILVVGFCEHTNTTHTPLWL